ncbi:MAG: hypothetical protein KDC33_09620 [Thermoleophilia bacterium]|nr:hypothetical protein [Thermoleophilia bacterium]
MGVGQFRLTDEDKEAVNSVDDKVMAAVESGDQAEFTAALKTLAELIQDVGDALADDEFVGSDAIVPDPETSVDEARSMLTEEGLIPD